MLNIRKILYIIVALAGCGLLPSGCVREDAESAGERHDVTVQLNVGTRTVDEVNGTPATEEAAIHSLRVYAFVGGKTAGHYFTSNVTSVPHTFFMDITFYSDNVQTVDFYVVANEAAMKGASVQLSERTTESQLKSLWFTDMENIQQYGLPMFCDDNSVALDFDKIKAESPSESGHEGHSWLDYDISFGLQRPVGKLGVFAAKPEGETGLLRVTGLTMLEEGTRMRNYLMTPTDNQLSEITNASGDVVLSVVSNEVTATLAGNSTDEERMNPANYTPVLNEPFYPFENPWGNGGVWNIPGNEKKGHVLKIDYEFDGEERTGLVYLPAVKRNHYYAVCCLMHNDGKITVEYTVADWDDGGKYDIEFNYPQYTNPIQPENGEILAGNTSYPQPTVWCSPGEESTDGCYTFKFMITGPTGQKWTPTLVGALGTPDNFEIKVYQLLPGGEKHYIEEPDDYVASSAPYYIIVRALKSDNVGKEVGLGIAYTRDWSSEGSALLLINGLTGNLKWDGSQNAEVVMIKQVDVPDDVESTKND